jgi:hypothetical protein
MDTKTRNYFNHLKEKPEHEPMQGIAPNLLARANKFIPLKNINNFHF